MFGIPPFMLENLPSSPLLVCTPLPFFQTHEQDEKQPISFTHTQKKTLLMFTSSHVTQRAGTNDSRCSQQHSSQQ